MHPPCTMARIFLVYLFSFPCERVGDEVFFVFLFLGPQPFVPWGIDSTDVLNIQDENGRHALHSLSLSLSLSLSFPWIRLYFSSSSLRFLSAFSPSFGNIPPISQPWTYVPITFTFFSLAQADLLVCLIKRLTHVPLRLTTDLRRLSTV